MVITSAGGETRGNGGPVHGVVQDMIWRKGHAALPSDAHCCECLAGSLLQVPSRLIVASTQQPHCCKCLATLLLQVPRSLIVASAWEAHCCKCLANSLLQVRGACCKCSCVCKLNVEMRLCLLAECGGSGVRCLLQMWLCRHVGR
eukprot:scaffold7508_cov18-Tisochrysis_lutea.AAC.1